MKRENSILILMPSLFVGGSELQVRYIIEGLEKAGKSVIVLVENGEEVEEQNYKFISEHSKVKFVFLHQRTFKPEEKNKKNKIKSLVCICKWILSNAKKEKIKWAMFTNLTGLLTVPLCRVLGINVLFNERNPGVKMCSNAMKRYCLKSCTKIVANSKSASEYMGKVLKLDVECINNGIKFRTTRETETDQEKIILIPARVTRIKNQLVAVKAIESLGDAFDYKLICAGQLEEQDYADQIKQYVEQHGLMRKISFLGYVSNIQELYDKSALIILPSYEEGTPNVMLEAYMNKKLCLASDIIMNRNVACNPNILFDPDNFDELAKKIKWILEIDKKDVNELLTTNFEFVSEYYDLNKMQKRYVEILR